MKCYIEYSKIEILNCYSVMSIYIMRSRIRDTRNIIRTCLCKYPEDTSKLDTCVMKWCINMIYCNINGSISISSYVYDLYNNKWNLMFEDL